MTNLKGLSSKEAENLLLKNGFNELDKKRKISPVGIFLSQFKDFITIVLIVATAISFFLGETSDAVTIFIILILNAVLGFVQEFKTEKSLEALSSLASPMAMVMRDGTGCKIASREIVPGDVLILEAGDRISADASIIKSTNLQVNESILTGESVPVEKSVSADKQLYMGTTISVGRAVAVAEKTGMSTKMGQIAHLLKGAGDNTTPLKKTLNKIGKELVIICFGVCMLIFIAGIFHGQSVYDMFFSSVSLAVAAIPEGMPAAVTVSLAIGVQRMLKRNALVRKLPAVETLGSTSVICSDKTGTLTENKMTVTKIFADGKYIDVSGNGYELSGEFSQSGIKVQPKEKKTLKMLLTCGLLCNNAIYKNDNISGDPTEIAIYAVSKKAGIDTDGYERILENPFDSDKKYMSVICQHTTGEKYMFVKGAPDKILCKCSKKLTESGEVPFGDKRRIQKACDDMTNDALRVLAFAYKKVASDSEKETSLVFLGLAGMIDPPRKEVYTSIEACYKAGIRPVMITGDHKNTACAIAKKLGFTDADNPITGDDILKMTDDELCMAVDKTSVFARVSPLDKLRIVRAFKRRKNVVAMTGDGVNDAPSLKEADIGVAMGKTGTDVAKQASDMVLLDDNFSTIVAAVEEGRMIFDNIRKFIKYLLACNLGEILLMGAAAFLGMPIPLLPIQVLWMNLVTDGLPALALGIDPPTSGIMDRRPRKKDEGIFSKGLGSMIAVSGMLIGASSLLAFSLGMYITRDIEMARTTAFCTLIFAELVYAFECKSEYMSLSLKQIFNNLYLVLAIVLSAVLTIVIMYIPFLSEIFKTVPLTKDMWMIVVLLGFVEFIINSVVLKPVAKKKYNSKNYNINTSNK